MTKIEKEKLGKGGEEKEKFQRLIEAYKIQNPVKYEQKKEALEKKLASL